MKKFFFFKRKFWSIIGLSVLTLFIVLFFLASSIAKSVLEKNSKEWLGRKIIVENLWANILTGTISLDNVKIYEKDDKSIFATIKQVETSMSLVSLIRSNYKFNSLYVDELSVSVVQSDSTFNFFDLIEKFRDTTSTNDRKVNFEIRNITLRNSNIKYTNVQRNFTENLNQIYFSCPIIAQNVDKNTFFLAFKDSKNGNFNALLDLNQQTKDYTLATISKDLNIGAFSPYIRDFLSFDTLSILTSHKLYIRGKVDKLEDVYCHGSFALTNMALTDSNKVRIAACDKFEVEIDSINTKAQCFTFKKAHFEKPYLFYELNNFGDNFSALLKMDSTDVGGVSMEGASNPLVIIVDFLKTTFQDYIVQNYLFKEVSISNGAVKYVDKTIPEPFDYTMTALNVSSNSFASQQDKITINFNSLLSNSGKAKGLVTFDSGFNDFDINYTVENLNLSDLNPYSKYYTSHALLKGQMYYTSTNKIRNGMLTSENNFQIHGIDVSKKLKIYAPEYSLPMRAAISLLKDVNGDINLNIPLTGNLSDPNYRLGNSIWNIFKNLILKVVASPTKIIDKKSDRKKGNIK